MVGPDWGLGGSSFFSSFSFNEDLKFRMPSPNPLPKSANLLGPNSSSAMPTINRMCNGENSPSPIIPISCSTALSNPYGNSRLLSIRSQRTH